MISQLFIKRPVMTTLVMIAILFFGIVAFKQIPVSDLPNVNYPAITVSVEYPGANPNTVANNVVSPLERQFLTIQGVRSIASTSSTGSATIVLQFVLEKPIDSAALDVQNAINTAGPELPQNLPYAPTYDKTNPSQTPILYFTVSSDTMPQHELYSYAYTFIGQRLSTISGVAHVGVYGSPFAVRVQVNPQKLAAKQVGIDEVALAIQNANVNIPTGTLFGKTGEYTIDVNGQLSQAAYYDSIIIKNDTGNIVRIRDVGRSLDSTHDDKQYLRYLTPDKDQACVIFGVLTQPGVNSMRVISDINNVLPSIEASLPGSVSLNRVFDKAVYIKEAVHDVEMTLCIAFLLVVFVIFFYLGTPMNTLIPALALPVIIVGTFAAMYLLGFTVDILSLLAITLSIGFLVDDAIVVLENIVRHVEAGVPPFEAALQGSKEIGFTIISMTLSLCSAFIPLLFMDGIIGKLFHEFAVVIVVAVLISGFISLTLTPMLCSRLIQPHHEQNKKTLMERFSEKFNLSLITFYDKTLAVVLQYRKATLTVGAFSIVLSVLLFKFLPADFLPPDDIGFIVVHTQAATGTSPFQMMKYQDQLTRQIKNHPAVETIFSIGALPDDNKGEMFIQLKSYKKRTSMPQIIEEMQKTLQTFPGVQSFLKPMPLIDLQVSTTDIKSPYQYTLQSLDQTLLYQSTETLIQQMKTLPGLTQVSTDLEIKQPQLNIEILRDKASALNLSAADIENALSFAFSASNLSPINDPEYQYYAILELEPKYYSDPSLLSQLYIRSSTNKLVPLSAATRQSETVGPLNINRFNGLPAVNIFFDIGTNALGPAVAKIENLARETLPPTVTGHVQGTADVFKDSFANLSLLLLVCIFVIYIILGILYENFLHPITVMSTLPPAALGGLLTLYIFHYPLSLYAFVGLILLLGIVMKNGIILIDFAVDAIIAGKTPLEAIQHACRARFRPILMTTFSALMGAVPIAMGIGGMTAQSRIPLGLVIIGGLIVSQILTLYLTPVLYLFLENFRERFKK
ncbi:MAG TPA: efflux RND transporter permease subunit [Rhabdochlamydiaceae bacterium]|jgi:HAE1 family hydrophobic/amphiphilic exporter-1|nr:efflux RND transporter permease subunit [Rhabdochlamydiaceae bacterium]